MIGDRAWRLARALQRRAKRARERTTDDGYRAYLDALPTDLTVAAGAAPLLALDLETDGLDAAKAPILQIGYVPLHVGTTPPGKDATVLERGGVELGGARQIDVGGDGGLDATSVVVHGITDTRRASGAALADALRETFGALTGRVLVAHCASVERSFLDVACEEVFGAPFVGATICTLELEQRWFPGPRTSDGFRLGKLRSRHGLPHYAAHDALNDALACGELLLAEVAARRSPDLRLVDLIERV